METVCSWFNLTDACDDFRDWLWLVPTILSMIGISVVAWVVAFFLPFKWIKVVAGLIILVCTIVLVVFVYAYRKGVERQRARQISRRDNPPPKPPTGPLDFFNFDWLWPK